MYSYGFTILLRYYYYYTAVRFTVPLYHGALLYSTRPYTWSVVDRVSYVGGDHLQNEGLLIVVVILERSE